MFFLIACTLPKTPEDVALRACHGMPGLEVDAAGQALLVDVIDPEEWAIWRADSDYGPVIERIGLGGYGTVRSNVSCRLESIDDDGADLVRTEPDLDLLLDTWDAGKVIDQPRLERAFRLDFKDGRVHLGLAEQRALRDEAWAHVEHGRWDEAKAGLDRIAFHDPMLPLWRHEVDRRREAVDEEQRSEVFLRELDALDASPETSPEASPSGE